jgi:type IV secretory pathway VirB9-like protein
MKCRFGAPLGDSVRWLIALTSSDAEDGSTPHVLVKPTEAGIRTDLIVATNAVRTKYGRACRRHR